MLERIAILIIMIAPVATFSLDPTYLTQSGYFFYLANVMVQLGALVLLCRYLWNRWALNEAV